MIGVTGSPPPDFNAEVEALLPAVRLPEVAARPLLQSYVQARRSLTEALSTGDKGSAEKFMVAVGRLSEVLGLTARQIPESGDRVGQLSVMQSIASARASRQWAERHEAERAKAAELAARAEMTPEEDAALAALVSGLSDSRVEMQTLYRDAFLSACEEFGLEPPPAEDLRFWRLR